MKSLKDSLHPLSVAVWGERVELINAAICEYFDFDDDDVEFERVVNVWTRVDHVIDVIKFHHIRDELREGV